LIDGMWIVFGEGIMQVVQKPRRLGRVALLLGLSTALAVGPLAPVLAQAADGPVSVEQLPSFAPIVDKVLPAVVNISVEQRQSAPIDDEGDDQDDQNDAPDLQGPNAPGPGTPFDQLLRRFFEQQQQGQHGQQPQAPRQHVTALGSGFIIDPTGYVVTNNHVVGQAERVSVIFQDGSEHQAKIVGKDVKSDLALLKIDAPKPLPYVQWGDSDKSKVGDWILAVGNPFGLGGTVTKGIISAHSRSLGSSSYVDFMQIDASVNRGNSGGPTFDLSGHVVGINTAIYSPNGGNVGIAFDIPSDTAKSVIDDLKAKGHVDRGWLGVQIQQVTPEIASAIGEDPDAPKGALIAAIDPKGPAAKSGLQVGDVVQKLDGKPIERLNDLPRLVAETHAGQSIALGVLRQGKMVDVQVAVAHLDEAKLASNDTGEASRNSPLGATLTELNPEIRARLHLSKDVSGALISRVAQDGPAASVGLEAGDVIQQINGQKISGPEDASEKVALAAKQKDKPVLLLVDRHGTKNFVAVPLNEGGQG
jgi:serine protease Do